MYINLYISLASTNTSFRKLSFWISQVRVLLVWWLLYASEKNGVGVREGTTI